MSEEIIHSRRLIERKYPDNSYWIFWCPACKFSHSIPVGGGVGPRWIFDGNLEKPTFTPSLRFQTNENLTRDGRLPDGQLRTLCHLNVTGGMIQYHADCPHEFAGKTVPMEEIPGDYGT